MFDQTQARYDAASRLPRLAVADGLTRRHSGGTTQRYDYD